MSKHTPLPWVIDMYLGSSNFLICKDAGDRGRGIAIAETAPESGKARENAQLIVTAVNNHAKLVEALRECVDTLIAEDGDGGIVKLEAEALIAQLDGEVR